MKALTICQPYAHLIAIGEKRVENRTWYTPYRGPLLIHAGKSRAWLVDDDPQNMAFGAIVAQATLVACVTRLEIAQGKHDKAYPWLRDHLHVEGPWCWVLEDVIALPEPVPTTGFQGLWNCQWPMTVQKDLL